MKGKIIALIGIGVFNAGLIVLEQMSNKHAKARAAIDAVECRAQEAKEAFEKAEKRCDIFKTCMEKEEKDIANKLKDWRIANDFERRKSDLVNSIQTGLESFKEQIGYSDQIESFTDDFNSALEAFKTSLDYDSVKRSLENSVREAKLHYERQKVAFDVAGDDISDTAMKLRHAAEESMNATVKEANLKLQALEKQVKDETERLTKIRTEKVRALEEKVAKEKIRLDKASDKEIERLNQELEKAKDDISKKVLKLRSKEQMDAAAMHEDDVRTIRLQKEADADLAADILKTRPNYERIGAFLKAKKVPKAVVASVAVLPLIPVGYLVFEYGAFIMKVIQGM